MIFRGTTLVRQQVAHSKSNNGRWTELSYSIQKVSSEATSASIPRNLSPSGRVSKKEWMMRTTPYQCFSSYLLNNCSDRNVSSQD